MAVIGINYEEPNPAKYESVYLHYGNGEKKVFASGNFVKDWYYTLKFISQNILDCDFICNSSSVDHFIMDGALYDSAYLRINDKGKPYFQYEWNGKAIEFFVAKGTQPTWKELKKLCDDSN